MSYYNALDDCPGDTIVGPYEMTDEKYFTFLQNDPFCIEMFKRMNHPLDFTLEYVQANREKISGWLQQEFQRVLDKGCEKFD
jgi:hypothetical protein